MKEKIEKYLFYFGLLAQIIGQVVFYKETFDNPFYVLILIILGYCSILYYIFSNLKEVIMKSESNIGIFQALKNNKSKSAIWAILFLTCTVAFGFTIKATVFENKNPIAEAPSFKQDFEKRETQFSLVKTYKVHWTGGGAFAETDKDSYPLAMIVDPEKDNLGTFWGTACALKFDIETRSDVPWVNVDEVRVKVNEYSDLPKYSPIFPAPFQDEKIYYVEIENPKIAKSNVFKASFILEEGKKKEVKNLRLKKGEPENVVIRINTKRPGIYNIECELLVRYQNQEEIVTLTRPTEWLFDGK